MTRAELQRWTLFGVSWRIVELGEGRAVTDLIACTGELVQRCTSEDRELLAWLRSSDGAGERGLVPW